MVESTHRSDRAIASEGVQLSVVSTLYCSEPYVREFHSRVSAAAASLTSDYEIILVDDGSPDGSLAVALELQQQDPRLTVIELARNFGHHKAIMTGLEYSRGQRVFLLDSDLEEEPELLAEFDQEMAACQADVVYGVQTSRKGGFLERFGGWLFYSIYNLLSTAPMPKDLVTARLMKRPYVESLLLHREREVCLAGLWVITGYKQVSRAVTKHSKGTTTYNFGRRIGNLVNAVTSFSNKPLVFIFYLGSIISLGAAVAALSMIIRRLFFGKLMAGWPSLIVSIWLLGGLTIFSLGVLGIYLSKIFMETKQRPYSIVRQVHSSESVGGPEGSGRATLGEVRGPLQRADAGS